MPYFKNIPAKTIPYSNFLGILNKIPCLLICLPFLDFCGTTTKNCSILCKYSVCFYFLFSWLLLPKICFPCTYCTNSALYPRSWLWMSLLWTSKGLFVLYVATVNWIIWHFSLMIVILIWSLNLIFNKKAFFVCFSFCYVCILGPFSFVSDISSCLHLPGCTRAR